MFSFPRTSDTPFVRIDFSNEAAWLEIVSAAEHENEDGFRANLSIINDAGFSGVGVEELSATAIKMNDHAVLFVADAMTVSHREHPILCVDLCSQTASFRVVPGLLWSVENNLALANMDFEEFAASVDPDGIFRGFRVY